MKCKALHFSLMQPIDNTQCASPGFKHKSTAAQAERLRADVPKLRSKAAGDVIDRLLGDDAVSGTLTTKALSRWASRRLFDRLVELGAGARAQRPLELPHFWTLTMVERAARPRRGGQGGEGRSGERRSADQRSGDGLFDRELDHLPPQMRWREWMNRVEATIFAASEPVTRERLARIVGKGCSIDLLIDDIREELRGRPYDLVAVAGGFRHLTRPAYADAIRGALGPAAGDGGRAGDLTQSEVLVLMGIAYFQPITRGELSSFFGKEISRDLIGHLRGAGLIASGPRSPTPGAPYTYVTTKEFLLEFGLDTLRDLPDFEALEDAGLLSKEKLLAGDILPEIFGADAQGVGIEIED